MINSVLFYGYNVLYCDIDVMLFSNPFLAIPNKLEYHLLTENVNNDYGTGFMYIQANEGTTALFKALYQNLTVLTDKSDSDILHSFFTDNLFPSVKKEAERQVLPRRQHLLQDPPILWRHLS